MAIIHIVDQDFLDTNSPDIERADVWHALYYQCMFTCSEDEWEMGTAGEAYANAHITEFWPPR